GPPRRTTVTPPCSTLKCQSCMPTRSGALWKSPKSWGPSRPAISPCRQTLTSTTHGCSRPKPGGRENSKARLWENPHPRNSQMEMGMRYYTELDGLRAVAVALVLLFHAKAPAFKGGYIGVDVFFVLSGFLISSILMHQLSVTGSINIGEFY